MLEPVGLEVSRSRAIAAIAYISPAWYHRHGHIVMASSWGASSFFGGAMAINMLPSPHPICFPLYSIRSQQEARQLVLLFSYRPPYIHVSSFIIRSRSMHRSSLALGRRRYAPAGTLLPLALELSKHSTRSLYSLMIAKSVNLSLSTRRLTRGNEYDFT